MNRLLGLYLIYILFHCLYSLCYMSNHNLLGLSMLFHSILLLLMLNYILNFLVLLFLYIGLCLYHLYIDYLIHYDSLYHMSIHNLLGHSMLYSMLFLH